MGGQGKTVSVCPPPIIRGWQEWRFICPMHCRENGDGYLFDPHVMGNLWAEAVFDSQVMEKHAWGEKARRLLLGSMGLRLSGTLKNKPVSVSQEGTDTPPREKFGKVFADYGAVCMGWGRPAHCMASMGLRDSSQPSVSFPQTCYICEEQGRESKAASGACMTCNRHGCRQAFHVTW